MARNFAISSGGSGGRAGWRLDDIHCRLLFLRSFPPDRRAAQPVVDGFAQPVVRNGHHRDGARALARRAREDGRTDWRRPRRDRRARTNSSPRRRRQFPKLLRGRTPATPRRARAVGIEAHAARAARNATPACPAPAAARCRSRHPRAAAPARGRARARSRARGTPPGRNSIGSSKQPTMVDSTPTATGAAIDDQVDPAREVALHMRGRGRRDVTREIGRWRHHGAAEGAQDVARHRMGGDPDRDRIETGGGEVGHRAVRRLRQHQRQRARPERLGQRESPAASKRAICRAAARSPTWAISGLKAGRPLAW